MENKQVLVVQIKDKIVGLRNTIKYSLSLLLRGLE